jgi:N-acetylmuramoyl-L-alanine amidase
MLPIALLITAEGKMLNKPYEVDHDSYHAKAVNKRIRFLVLHYTAGNFKTSVAELTGPSVSVHYLVPDADDQTYKDAGFNGMRIFSLADENERTWHAGVSAWAGRTNLNDTSNGIEIVNLATDDGHGKFTFPPYTKDQISAVKQLASDILSRYPDISPVNVVGHSDITPGRKSDPGPSFPWMELYQAGIGAWYDKETENGYERVFGTSGLPSKEEIVEQLHKYGYNVSNSTSETGYKELIRAFQMHFNPQKDDSYGTVDVKTAAILYALVEKYKK